MPRPRQRACLESGFKLDLNRLRRQGFVRPGARVGPKFIRWTYTYTGEHIASGQISADMERPDDIGYFRIHLGSLSQTIFLRPERRHFGGVQWYFQCPMTHRRVGALDAARRSQFRQPASVAPTGRLFLPIRHAG